MQSHKFSFIESLTNVVAGYFVALVSQIILFPFFGIETTLRDNALIGAWFTVISICRSYILRRIFNGIKNKRRVYNAN